MMSANFWQPLSHPCSHSAISLQNKNNTSFFPSYSFCDHLPVPSNVDIIYGSPYIQLIITPLHFTVSESEESPEHG